MIAAENRWLLRAPAQITIWLLLLIVSLGPQHSLFVCTTGQCRAQAATAGGDDGCCCDKATAPNAATEEHAGSGTNKNGARRCHKCCIDVALLTETGPLPRSVGCPDLEAACIGAVHYSAADENGDRASALTQRNTGPPRTDRRTNLIATTILRR